MTIMERDETGGGGEIPWGTEQISPAEPMARILGIVSALLGVVFLVVPGAIASLMGVRDTQTSRRVVRCVGVRELLVAPGLVFRTRPVSWAWLRVAGDLMDFSLLLGALSSRGARRGRIGAAMAGVTGITTIDLATARRLTRAVEADDAIHAARAITIRRSPREVYDFVRDLHHLPEVMYHIEEVQQIDDRRSHWKLKAPAGRHVEWDAEIVEDAPGETIAWSTTDGDVRNAGRVDFRPADGLGTEVTLELRYEGRAGSLGKTLSRLFGEEPGQQAGDALRRLKQVLETGEVLRSDASPEGVARPWLLHQRPARPLEPEEAKELLEERA